MLEYEALMPYIEKYSDIQTMPLRIVCKLKCGSPVVNYDPVNLDNLLARAVVDIATNRQGLPDSDEAYILPVPLRCLWRSGDGHPLWASTVFTPVGESAADVLYWHKRAITGRWTKKDGKHFTIKTTAGRWMERRTPVPTVIAGKWEAFAEGNANEIAALLAEIKYISKRRSIGCGEVDEWQIEPLYGVVDEPIIVGDGILLRPVPQEAACVLPGIPKEPTRLIGWTPPQWKPSLFREGWPPGTAIQ